MPNDEERYAAYFMQAEDHNTNPLETVRRLRSEQLAACDLRKHAELAKLRQTTKTAKATPPNQTCNSNATET